MLVIKVLLLPLKESQWIGPHVIIVSFEHVY